jgi:3-phosphoglycerate kinase
LRNLRDVELDGKRVLMRVDFNVPMDKQGNILDDGKMRGALPTIEYVLAHNGKLILMSHLGRPKGKPDPKYSLKGLASHLQRLLNGMGVSFAEDCVGPEVEEKVNSMNPGRKFNEWLRMPPWVYPVDMGINNEEIHND